MTATKATVEEALRELGIGTLAEFLNLHGLQWMNLNDPVDRQTIETAVRREARYQEIFFSVE